MSEERKEYMRNYTKWKSGKEKLEALGKHVKPFDKNHPELITPYSDEEWKSMSDASNTPVKSDVEPKSELKTDSGLSVAPKKEDSTAISVKEKSEKKKKKLKQLPASPEQFADFSVGLEKSTLALRQLALKDNEEKYIRESAKTLAELYPVPKLIAIPNYAFAMTFPHIARYFEKKSELTELQIVKMSAELKAMGIDLSSKELLLMSKAERDDIISKAQKAAKINAAKSRLGVSDNSDKEGLITD